MSNLYSIGAMNQLGDALENADFTTEEVTKLKQFKNLSGIKDVLNGKAEIKLISPLPKPIFCSWREVDGVIYFSVTSNGTTGEEWLARLGKKGYHVSAYTKILLLSEDFKQTSGVTTEVAVLKGVIFKDVDRITKKIRAEAERRKLSKPNVEVACLIREMFTDKEIEDMGLSWIVTMHEPIKDSTGALSLLRSYRYGNGSCLYPRCDDPDGYWDSDGGFAFEVVESAA